MKPNDKLKSALVALMLRCPFFGSIAMKRPIVLDDGVTTACVAMDGTIRVAPAFVETLDREQLVFLIAHEAMHVAYAHLPRLMGRDPQVWNVATDAVINDMLKREHVGRPIDGGVDMPGSADRSADDIYNELMKSAKQDPQGAASGGGTDGSSVPVQDLRPEDLSKDLSEGEVKRRVSVGKMEIAAAAQSARMQGKLSGSLARMLENYLESTVPWYQVLERFMVSKAEQHHTWARPNKRFLQTAYLPRRERLPSMGRLVIGVDVSGSISDHEVEGFLGHVNAIIEQCNPREVVVLYTTSVVEREDTFRREDYPVKASKQRWYGGTDMGAVTRWIDRSGEDTDLAVIFTDGYTPKPEKVPCDIVWAVTTDCEMSGFPGTILRVTDE